MARYYLVGDIPVQMDESDEGIWIVAFNPLMGGYIYDSRYYSWIKRSRFNDTSEIDFIMYHKQVIALASEFGVPHQIPQEEIDEISALIDEGADALS